MVAQQTHNPSHTAQNEQTTQWWAFFEGAFVHLEQARVSVQTHALQYGTGCFEGIRGYWNETDRTVYLFRLREHFERLNRSAHIINIKPLYTVDELCAMTVELVARNGQHADTYVRPFYYKSGTLIGVKMVGVPDAFSMYAAPMGNYVNTGGIRVMVSSWRRVDDNVIPPRAKVTGSYINAALAKNDALVNGFDEAITLNTQGFISEGSAENIFIVRGNQIITPGYGDSILEGITRSTVIDLIRQHTNLEVVERLIGRTEIYIADEVFMCGTGAQIAPVVEIDHRSVGTGVVGPHTVKIQALYHEITHGLRPEYKHWLTPVVMA